MNYHEFDKFPNHDSLDCPCVVYIRVVDNFYYSSVCKSGMPQWEQIPRELGEYFRDNDYKKVISGNELSLTSLINALADISALIVDHDDLNTIKDFGSLIDKVSVIAIEALHGGKWTINIPSLSRDWYKLDNGGRPGRIDPNGPPTF